MLSYIEWDVLLYIPFIIKNVKYNKVVIKNMYWFYFA